MIVRPRYRGPEIPTTYAVDVESGVGSGIVVADGAEVDPGESGFALFWRGDFLGGTKHLLSKVSTQYYEMVMLSGGLPRMALNGATGSAENVTLAQAVSGTSGLLVGVLERGSPNDTVKFYWNGALLGSATTSAKGSISNSSVLGISGRPASNFIDETITIEAGILNFAPTAAENLDWYVSGMPEDWQYGSNVALTSGTIVSGGIYIIDTFVSGDDFTNVGAASNASGVTFTASGATPTTWTNGSSLRKLGATLHLAPNGIATGSGLTWQGSANGVDGTLPASGATKVSIRK